MRRREREAWGWRVAQRLESLFAGLPVELTFLCGHTYTAEVRWRLPASGIGRVALALNGTYVLTYEPDDTSMFKPSGPGRVSPDNRAASAAVKPPGIHSGRSSNAWIA